MANRQTYELTELAAGTLFNIPVQDIAGSAETKRISPFRLLGLPLGKTSNASYNTTAYNMDSAYLIAADANNSGGFNMMLSDTHPNKMRAVNLSGAKSVLSGLATGMLANNMGIYVIYKHQTPSAVTARVIFNLLLKADGSVVKPIMTLTGNTLVIKGFATVADADITTGVTLATRTLEVGKTYCWILAYGGTTASGGGISRLFENGILIYQNLAITYHAEYIASVLAGVKLQPQLEGLWNRFGVMNFTPTNTEAGYVNNNDRPDLFIIPDSWQWGSNSEKVTNGTFDSDTGWTLASGYASISGGIATIKGRGALSISIDNHVLKQAIFGDTVKKYRIKFDARWKTGTSAGYLSVGSGYFQLASIVVTDTFQTYIIDTYNDIYVLYMNGNRYITFGSPTVGAEFEIDNVSVIQEGVIAGYNAAGMVLSLGAAAAARTIVAGVAYQITTAFDNTDTTNHPETNGLAGRRFIAANSIPLVGGYVKPVICSAWNDSSTNAINATISGEPVLVNVPVETVVGQGIIDSKFVIIAKGPLSADGLLAEVPAGFIVKNVLVEKTAGSSADTLKIRRDSTSGTIISNDIVTAALSATTEDNLYGAVITRPRQSKTDSKSIYVSGLTATTATCNFTIELERV